MIVSRQIHDICPTFRDGNIHYNKNMKTLLFPLFLLWSIVSTGVALLVSIRSAQISRREEANRPLIAAVE